MPRSRKALQQRRQYGFTLIEMVIVIVLTSILAAIVSVFIVAPVQAYLASAARNQMVDQADTALRRIGRDLALSLPNSGRVSADGLSLELIPTTGAARYATQGADPLLFGVLDTSFNLVGPGLTLGSNQQLVFYNLGPDVPDANAYADNSGAGTQATSNRRMATNGAGLATNITISSLAPLPVALQSPPYRVYAVSTPVTYRCDTSPSVQTLSRYQGYGFQATQPNPPSGGTVSVLATGVRSCQFSYAPAAVASRAALFTLRMTLNGDSRLNAETVSLYHAIHVDNMP
ncbi:PulJ/GspJ family protein [Roseateles koreensis]|uniref:Type II secretion system protein n=1 Tax=Roseateles koreensis TaxID=2987526 RepID=A0ABT5KNG0_9BURK|nr:type II secretion system protein [Roseateles koreensis]MDC8784453.1 type II secretion system protein [Roseateles koreensis]